MPPPSHLHWEGKEPLPQGKRPKKGLHRHNRQAGHPPPLPISTPAPGWDKAEAHLGRENTKLLKEGSSPRPPRPPSLPSPPAYTMKAGAGVQGMG